MIRHALVPIRDFSGMTRLSPLFSAEQRRSIAMSLATHVSDTCHAAGFEVRIVSASDDVRAWSSARGWTTIDDHGPDLSTAMSHAVRVVPGPWIVVHADLPLIDADILRRVGSEADTAGTALAPSLDGGTNVIASVGPYAFAFGPDSFTAHLARSPSASVVIDRRLALELDVPAHAVALSRAGLMPSLDS